VIGAIVARTPSEQNGPNDSAEIQAVSRAAQILALYGPDTPVLTAVEAAVRLGLNRSTAYRYCTSLVTAGLLERGMEAGTFIPGGLLLQLGAYSIGRRRVMDLAPPHLRSLSNNARMTAVLSLWGSSGPIVSRVEEEVAPIVLVTVRVGSHLPLDTAQAKVFAAFHFNDFVVSRLLANLPHDLRARLMADITVVRKAGYCATSSTPGIVAIAAPVFDEYGICASLAVVSTDNTLATSSDAPQLAMVVTAARELTKEMGGSYVPDNP